MDPANDAFDDLVSLFDLVAQWGMFVAAVTAAWFAIKAYQTQDRTLQNLLDERSDKDFRQRIVESPFFELDVHLNREVTSGVLMNGRTVDAECLLLNLANTAMPFFRHISEPDEEMRLQVILRNLRPQNEVISVRIKPEGDVAGLRSLSLLGVSSLHAAGQRAIRGEFWCLGYTITAAVARANVRAVFVIEFETKAGHRDTHRYEHIVGHGHWARVDPPSL